MNGPFYVSKRRIAFSDRFVGEPIFLAMAVKIPESGCVNNSCAYMSFYPILL